MATLQSEIEALLAAGEPDVEVLLAEPIGGGTLRVYIDHPDGVTLALCERVTAALTPLRERYTLEVSSPGIERPLTKPEHFRRFVGRRARVRTRGDIDAHAPAAGTQSAPQTSHVPAAGTQPAPQTSRAGAAGRSARAAGWQAASRRSYTGELVGASDTAITLAADGALVTIPYTQIRRSNLVEE